MNKKLKNTKKGVQDEGDTVWNLLISKCLLV